MSAFSSDVHDDDFHVSLLCCKYLVVDNVLLPFQDTVSVHRPGFYAERFMNFMTKSVFRKIPSRKQRTNSIYVSAAPQSDSHNNSSVPPPPGNFA